MQAAPCTPALVTFTLQQLRAATQAGGILSVTIKAQGNGFFVQASTRAGQAVLVTARNKDPRSFKSPLQAMLLLKQIGIVQGSFDSTLYNSKQKETPSRPRKRQSNSTGTSKLGLRWARMTEKIASPVQASLDDPCLNIDEEQARRLLARHDASKARTNA